MEIKRCIKAITSRFREIQVYKESGRGIFCQFFDRNNALRQPKVARESYRAEVTAVYCSWKFQNDKISKVNCFKSYSSITVLWHNWSQKIRRRSERITKNAEKENTLVKLRIFSLRRQHFEKIVSEDLRSLNLVPKSQIEQKNRTKRLMWAKTRLSVKIPCFWNSVTYSDETMVILNAKRQFSNRWRKNTQYLPDFLLENL